MLEAVGNDAGVLDAGLLIHGFKGIVFADNYGEVARGIEKDLIAADSMDGFERDWLAMSGQFRKGLLLTNTVGIPCHIEGLRPFCVLQRVTG